MISGLVSPKSISLMNREDINQLLKKSKLMFEVSRVPIIGSSFMTFCLSGIPLILNYSYNLFLIEIFWTLLFTAFQYFCFNINFSQMTYFCIICLYLKLKLTNANNSIRKSFEKKYKMTNYEMKNILIIMDFIISEKMPIIIVYGLNI
jgi:hypothetical protein